MLNLIINNILNGDNEHNASNQSRSDVYQFQGQLSPTGGKEMHFL